MNFKTETDIEIYDVKYLGPLLFPSYFFANNRVLRVSVHSNKKDYLMQYKGDKKNIEMFRYDKNSRAGITQNFYNILRWLYEKMAVKITQQDYANFK